MLTVSQLAARCGLSRSTLLYYESIGLLKAASRSASNYRRYSERDAAKLEQIRAYRDAGLTLTDVQALLKDANAGSASVILNRRFLEIDREIGILRRQQQAILSLLKHSEPIHKHRRNEMMTKDKWTTIMRSSGFSDEEMTRWHCEFEHSAPDDHQQFLEYLQIGPEEIAHIREWSRNRGAHAHE
ncbi:MAG TPA: MerR family transcriptional regulator [Bryobacteraceae bacterium]|jgi:DNA-binding transcriptional MerR regulator